MSGAARGSRAGSRLGPYYLKRLIGWGAFGEVYEAEDTVKNRVVALKLLQEAYSQDPVFRQRLQREARAAGRLQEPHVVPIHHYGEIEGLLFVDMRLIDGQDLASLLTRDGPLTPARAVAIVRQVAAALDAAHAIGVLHRDIKPGNVLITGDEFAYLVDFGLASAATDEKLTHTGAMLGTLTYMAPERFGKGEVTYRADTYSLACVLYECLTGSAPYPGSDMPALISAHLMAPIPRPSRQRPGIPIGFDEVMARGMAKKPEDRYDTAGDLALAAYEALSGTDQRQAVRILEDGEARFATRPAQPPAPSQWSPPMNPIPAPQQPSAPPPGVADTVVPRAQGPAMPAYGPAYGPPGPIPPQYPQDWPPAAPPARRKRNRWFISGAAAAAVVAVIAGGILVWVNRDRDEPVPPPAPGPTPTTTTTSPLPIGWTADQKKLFNALPAGYNANSCQPETAQAGAAAQLVCNGNSESGGPTKSEFFLINSAHFLSNGFNSGVSAMSATTACPSEVTSGLSGQVACGTFKGRPYLVWTNPPKQLLGQVAGSDATALYDWFSRYAKK